MSLVSTVCNVQAPFVQLEALVNGINDDKRMILKSINPPSWNMNTEVHVGPGIYVFINRLGSSR